MCPVVLILLKLVHTAGAWFTLFFKLNCGHESLFFSILGTLNVLIIGEGTKDSFLPTMQSMFELVICCFCCHGINYKLITTQ